MSSRRYRSTVACQNCRQRKVRCTVTVTGVPCIGCSQDGTECTIKRRRGLRHSNDSILFVSRLPNSASPGRNLESFDTGPLPSTRVSPSPIQMNQMEPFSAGVEFSRPVNLEGGNQSSSLSDANRNRDEELSGATIANASLRSHGHRPFYTGDSTGFTTVLDIMSPEQGVPRHILLPSSIPPSLSTRDREFLVSKGCLDLPQNDICGVLLRAYFCHVHPLIPVVEPAEILKFQHSSHAKECNLLLLWAIFFVAIHFVPIQTVIAAGYSGKKEMKEAFFCRAKCMYDNGGETDKIVKLQAALLLGFWYSEDDDYTQVWYWTGIAINLCFIMGLHRDPDAIRFNTSITDRRRSLWRRLWWSCYFRDCWLGLTLGRPLRVSLKDCNTPMLSLNDITRDLREIPQEIAEAYIPEDFDRLAQHCIVLIELTKLLGKTLNLSYQSMTSRPHVSEIEHLEAEIMQLKLPQKSNNDKSPLVTFSIYHLQLHYQATLITFYRPCMTKPPEDLPTSTLDVWQAEIRRKIDSAAFQTNMILDNLAREGLLCYTCPMTPPLLVPAMHIHLLNCKSEDTLSRQLGLNKLEFCMIVMKEMQDTYTVASVYRGIFNEAIRQLFPNTGDEAINTDSRAPPLAVPPSQESYDLALGPIPSEGLIDELLHESSFFNVWESLSMLQ